MEMERDLTMENNQEIVDGEFREIVDEAADSLVVEEESTENTDNEEKEVHPYLFIKTATPYKILLTKKDGKTIATLILLCRDRHDKLFVIDKNNILTSEDQKDIVECIPFTAEESAFGNEKICTNLVLNYLDNYIITDKNFFIARDHLLDTNPYMTITLTDVKTKEEVVAEIHPDTFSAISFIISYINESIINEYDLALATVISGKEKTENDNVELFEVCDIEKVVAMAPAECDPELKPHKSLFEKLKSFFKREKEVKHSTSIGVVLKVSRYKNGNKEIVQLLTPFDIGVEFDESKFKGTTIAGIEKDYFGDGDQYVSTLITHSVTIDGLDKTYMMIRGKSKNGDIKIFLLDSTVTKDLKEKINEY